MQTSPEPTPDPRPDIPPTPEVPQPPSVADPITPEPFDSVAGDPDRRVRKRASLLASERAAGSADPEAQARAILAASDRRAAERERAPTTSGERRMSEETAP